MNPSKIRDPRCWKKWESSGAIGRVSTPGIPGYQRTTPWHELVHDVIDEAVGNWTRNHTQAPDPQVKAVLLQYATAVAAKVLRSDTPRIDFSPGWGRKLSDRVYGMLRYDAFKNEQIPFIVAALQGRFGDTTDQLKNGLWGYSLAKIANVVGMVVYMEKIGFPPEMLQMTPEEANASLLEMATRLSKSRSTKVLVLAL